MLQNKNNLRPGVQRFWILTVLSSPIWADTIRRFFWYSDMMFFAVTLLGAATLAWIVSTKKNSLQLTRGTTLSFAALSVWAVVMFFLTHNNIKIFAVWILATYLPMLFLLISRYFHSADPDAARWMYLSCTMWVVIMAGVAFAEVWLGLNHPINRLPIASEAASVEMRKE